VIGATALTLFRPDEEPMVPFAVGDRLSFVRVAPGELDGLRARGGGAERLSS
jgi:allophanate hydrolase subunit 1